MATFTWELYMGATPTWSGISGTIVFSGSNTDLTQAITVANWNDGTHDGTDDPGTDNCGANHANNVKWISSSEFDTGGGTETINDTNLVATECTLRIHFNHSTAVAITNARFYCYDGSTVTTQATGVDVVCFESGRTETAWTVINDDTVAGALTNGSIGGDNSGERKSLADSASATDHYWILAVSASPESVGDKTAFDFGCALTYS
jgi:hypothetical protein